MITCVLVYCQRLVLASGVTGKGSAMMTAAAGGMAKGITGEELGGGWTLVATWARGQ